MRGYIKAKNINTVIQSGVFKPIIFEEEYQVGSLIIYEGNIYRCKSINVWTGSITDDWEKITGNDSNNTKTELEEKYTEVLTKSKAYTDEKTNKNVYDPEKTYYKNDEIIIVPESYDSITKAAGTYKTHIGQSIRYNQETTYRQFDVKMRARVDSARDPFSFPDDWYPCDPRQVVEQGTSSNGDYTLYINGISECFMSAHVDSTSKAIWTQKQTRPIYTVSYKHATVTPSNEVVSYFAVTSIDSNGDTLTITAHEINNVASSWSGLVKIISTDVWYLLN